MTDKTAKVVPIADNAVATDAPTLPGFEPGVPLVLQAMVKPELRDALDWVADGYAKSPSAPPHIKNNPMVVVSALDISLSRGLNPLQVINGMFAHKGKIGMTAELMLAILQSPKAPVIDGEPVWEEVGDWSRLDGKWEMKKGQNGEYAAATYTKKDEEGLGVKCRIKWVNEPEPKEYGPFWLKDAQPRFSVEWAYRAKYQLRRRTLRDIVRQFRSGALYGMVVDQEEAEMFRGPDNAKVVNEPSSPSDKMDDIAKQYGYDADMDDAQDALDQEAEAPEDTDSGSTVDSGSDADTGLSVDSGDLFGGDEPVTLWMSDKNPEHETVMSKAAASLTQVIKRSNDTSHVMLILHRNREVLEAFERDVVDKINKIAQDRLGQLNAPDGNDQP